MRYWDEMRNKYGFSDGDAIPDGVLAYRQMYIQVVNTLAQQLESKVRAVPYDRIGMHNRCLIVFIGAEEVASIPNESHFGAKWAENAQTRLMQDNFLDANTDTAMKQAIDFAHDLDLHEYITVELARDETRLGDLLNELASGTTVNMDQLRADVADFVTTWLDNLDLSEDNEEPTELMLPIAEIDCLEGLSQAQLGIFMDEHCDWVFDGEHLVVDNPEHAE